MKDGQEVVIKVRHQNVENLIMKDLECLKILCEWAAWIDPIYDIRKVIEEWIPAVKVTFYLKCYI